MHLNKWAFKHIHAQHHRMDASLGAQRRPLCPFVPRSLCALTPRAARRRAAFRPHGRARGACMRHARRSRGYVWSARPPPHPARARRCADHLLHVAHRWLCHRGRPAGGDCCRRLLDAQLLGHVHAHAHDDNHLCHGCARARRMLRVGSCVQADRAARAPRLQPLDPPPSRPARPGHSGYILHSEELKDVALLAFCPYLLVQKVSPPRPSPHAAFACLCTRCRVQVGPRRALPHHRALSRSPPQLVCICAKPMDHMAHHSSAPRACERMRSIAPACAGAWRGHDTRPPLTRTAPFPPPLQTHA